MSPFGDTLATTTPAADGSYSFGELATQAGYTVRADVPDGCVVIGPAEQAVSNRGNDNDPASRADFEVRAIVPQPISGTVRDDDGAPVAGVTVTLAGPGGPATTTTAADGSYLFDNNPIGTGYTVTIAVPAGYTAGPGGTQIGGIAVTNAPVPGQDFTVVDLPAVSGTVTGAGSGLGGVQVVLTPAGGGTPSTTVTTGDGSYEVDGLPPGDYTLEVIPPDGWTAPGPQDITVPTGGLTGQDIALTVPVRSAAPSPLTTSTSSSTSVPSAARRPGGGTVRYKLTVRNKGTDAASRSTTLVDRLPAGLELVAARSRGWACTTRKAADTVSCVLRKDIGAGRKAAPVFVVTQATRAATGRVVNVARVRVAGESVRSNNTATAVVTVVPVQLPATGFRLLTWP